MFTITYDDNRTWKVSKNGRVVARWFKTREAAKTWVAAQ